MTNEVANEATGNRRLPNGAGAAALLSAGLGAFSMAVLDILADHSPATKKLMIFYTPTGPLSGVTTVAIAVWVVCWIALDLTWKRRDVAGWIISAGFGLIAIAFLLMIPFAGDVL
jgi:hypothetical protein